MSYRGYLIRVGGPTGIVLPMKFIKLQDYNCTPNQRMESKAQRSVTGVLHRTTVEHTSTKVEFTTPIMKNADLNEMMTLFRNSWTSVIERKLTLEYYDMETDSYKVGEFYMPDIKFSIVRIDDTNNIIYYNETRVAFIEY